MRRGCIAVGEVCCDGCGRIIKHPERYLAVDEDGGKISRYCLDCCLEKGYVDYKEGKGERIPTFFPGKY
ncbi:hypothetical protein ES703_34092 [subsurface metagenome]